MGRVTVKVNLRRIVKGLDSKKINDKKTLKKVGKEVVKMMKSDISKGKSPVRGIGRFPGYIAQRDPAAARGKQARKVAKGLTGAQKQRARAISRETSQQLATKYPNSVRDKFPDKKLRPINLKLSGVFLKHLNFRVRTGKFVWIGMQRPTEKIKKMFATHNDGTHKHVPRRQFLPNGKDDQFTPRIMRTVKDIYKRRIERLIFDLNKR